ncbi:DUF3306 domain-containing protein [Planktotalea arctica]|uniref:DUF3306 domain-containing protein n=1 Tax=Planktotalea arctica TaxID=1481893 RepID=UPI000A170682|nr:DUF3306 domain-containing protein [Planktotalea arctica]
MSVEQNFWSRRKAAVEAEQQAESAALEADALAAEHAVLEEKSDAEILAELDLPDPDTMGKGDDFSVFMKQIVPDRIRRRALRTLWRTNPVLANVDMLVDYGEDFTDSAMVIENMQTAYQVGKGMLKHIEEMARQAEEDEVEIEALEPDLDENTVDDEDVLMASDDIENDTYHYEDPDQDDAQEDLAQAAFTPRRMKFTVEDRA